MASWNIFTYVIRFIAEIVSLFLVDCPIMDIYYILWLLSCQAINKLSSSQLFKNLLNNTEQYPQFFARLGRRREESVNKSYTGIILLFVGRSIGFLTTFLSLRYLYSLRFSLFRKAVPWNKPFSLATGWVTMNLNVHTMTRSRQMNFDNANTVGQTNWTITRF